MQKLLLAAALASAAFTGCKKSDKAPATEREASLPMASVDEVDKGIASGQCVPVDANGEGTRKKMGVVPGAVLLTSSEDFKLDELPADKNKELVFYCANTQCGASHKAAHKAIAAGYSKVKVMPDGIAGWVAAGKKVTQI